VDEIHEYSSPEIIASCFLFVDTSLVSNSTHPGILLIGDRFDNSKSRWKALIIYPAKECEPNFLVLTRTRLVKPNCSISKSDSHDRATLGTQIRKVHVERHDFSTGRREFTLY